MGCFFTITCILLTCAVVVGRSAAQSAPSPPPAGVGPDCSTLIYDMMDCMTFLTGNEAKPDQSCCLGLKTVVETDAECICYAMNTAASLGMDLNMTKAVTMPSACGVSGVPPISSCDASASPGGSPAYIPPSASPTLPPSSTEPPSAATSPTTEPPSAAASPGDAPAALSPFAPAPEHKKRSGAFTIASTSLQSFLLLLLLSSLVFNAWI